MDGQRPTPEDLIHFTYQAGQTQLETRINNWNQSIHTGQTFQTVLDSNFSKLAEETEEAHAEASTDPINRELLATEAVDVAIVAIGIVGSLGYSFTELANTKQSINERKYPPEMITHLLECGYSHEDAMALLKATWPDRKIGQDLIAKGQRMLASQPPYLQGLA